MPTRNFQKQAITLIDDLKGVCANYGLGNSLVMKEYLDEFNGQQPA